MTAFWKLTYSKQVRGLVVENSGTVGKKGKASPSLVTMPKE